MPLLLVATLLWALSFGLIKRELGGLDPNFVAWVRMALSLPLLLPFVRGSELSLWPGPRWRSAAVLVAIGAVQYGLMYTGYLAAFGFAQAHEVALYTVTTPLYVSLLHDAWARRFDPVNLGLAALAVLGAVVLQPRDWTIADAWIGFVLVQGVEPVLRARTDGVSPDAPAGAAGPRPRGVRVAVSRRAAGDDGDGEPRGRVVGGRWGRRRRQAWTLLYLGVVASGAAFFLWNRGAVTAPPAALAVFNNLKIPLAVAAALTIFGERADLLRLAVGGGLMLIAAALAARRSG